MREQDTKTRQYRTSSPRSGPPFAAIPAFTTNRLWYNTVSTASCPILTLRNDIEQCTCAKNRSGSESAHGNHTTAKLCKVDPRLERVVQCAHVFRMCHRTTATRNTQTTRKSEHRVEQEKPIVATRPNAPRTPECIKMRISLGEDKVVTGGMR